MLNIHRQIFSWEIESNGDVTIVKYVDLTEQQEKASASYGKAKGSKKACHQEADHIINSQVTYDINNWILKLVTMSLLHS